MATERTNGANLRYQNNFGQGLLKGLQYGSGQSLAMERAGLSHTPYGMKHIYGGTVTADEIKKRRKVTRAARKANLRRRRGF
jgi:hypothetical protein